MTLSLQQKRSLKLLIQREPKLYKAIYFHLNTRGEMLTFGDRPYMIELYRDKTKEIVIKKSVQCGVSEYLIIDMLDNAENGLSTFYVLPTYSLRNTFVANRIDRLFNNVPYYNSQMSRAQGDADSSSMKHYAKAALKFVGSNTPNEFKEFPADVLVIDEYDECDADNIAKAPDRIKASKHRIKKFVGNPTFEDFGIDAEYKLSDQKEWVVKCDSCGNYQKLDFFKQVVKEINENAYELRDKEWSKKCGRDILCYCIHCEKPFNRLNRDSHWERQNPSSDVSGYHFTRMMQANTTIEELYTTFRKALSNPSKMQAFYNSDLGEPYRASNVALSDYLLEQCVEKGYFMPQTAQECVAGIDVGSVLHVKISQIVEGKRKSVFIGTVPRFEDVDNLIKVYGINCCVIDALPETHKAKELRDRHPGRVFLCTFHAKEGSVKGISINDEEQTISVDRTQSMDDSHADILLGNVILPENARTIADGDCYDQMCAPKRTFDQDGNRYVWKEGSKADHFRLADNYEKLASVLSVQMGVKAWDL